MSLLRLAPSFEDESGLKAPGRIPNLRLEAQSAVKPDASGIKILAVRVDADEKWLGEGRPSRIWYGRGQSSAVDLAGVEGGRSRRSGLPVLIADVATISESLQQPLDVMHVVIIKRYACAIRTSFSSPSQRRDHDSLAHARQKGKSGSPDCIQIVEGPPQESTALKPVMPVAETLDPIFPPELGLRRACFGHSQVVES